MWLNQFPKINKSPIKYSLLIILLFILCNTTKAADTLTTNFINAIYPQIIDAKAKYYYLYMRSHNIVKNDRGTTVEIKSLNFAKRMNDSIPTNDFKALLTTDTTTVNWRDYKLINARVVDENHEPIYCPLYPTFKIVPKNTPDSVVRELKRDHCTIPILYKTHRSKNTFEALKKTAKKEYLNRPIEEEECYFLSKPIFSKDGNYALISVDKHGSGRAIFFKRSGGRWVRVNEIDGWIS